MPHYASIVYVIALTTQRTLWGLRSDKVSTRPLSWAPFGGAADPGETPEQTALRELEEETGYEGPIELVRIDAKADPSGGGTITTFVGYVPDEFPPILNWEHLDAQWV